MSTNPYAGQPFTSSDGEIAAALEQVSIPTLLLSLVHITGDPRFIREFKQAASSSTRSRASCPRRTRPRPARWHYR